MSKKILVTDSLFIYDEHVKVLEDAGYEVERLNMPAATEDELVKAVKGKVGYILGGIEKITDRIIDAADELKVIVFTGADYKFFIPGWKKAQEKGILIANSAGSNADAVAEFAFSMALAMQRDLFELGKTGFATFKTTGSLKDATIGIVGAGAIGSKLVTMSNAFSPLKTQYFSRTEKLDLQAEFVSFKELLETSDIILVAIPAESGQLFDKNSLAKIKEGALIVSISDRSLFDFEALMPKLQTGHLRMAIDWPAPDEEFEKLPLGTWFNTNDHTAYNTKQANLLASDRAVESMINLLATGKDRFQI